jgi:hypothetical protein
MQKPPKAITTLPLDISDLQRAGIGEFSKSD